MRHPEIERKKILILVLVCVFYTGLVDGQVRKSVFLGIQPGVTQEKFYKKNELDINILPFVFQLPVNKRIDFRLVTVANYHFGGVQEFYDVGVNMAAPIYLKKKEETNTVSGGFYIGPMIGLGKNYANDHRTLTLAFEPGYLFHASKRFSLSIGMQFGGSYFDYNNLPDKWRQHFGVKINLGFWL